VHVYAFSSLTTGFSSFSAEQMSPKKENLLIIKTRHSPHLVPRDSSRNAKPFNCAISKAQIPVAYVCAVKVLSCDLILLVYIQAESAA